MGFLSTNVLEQTAAPNFMVDPQDSGNTFIQNYGTYLTNCTEAKILNMSHAGNSVNIQVV